MGSQLYGAGKGNPYGHFEDVEIVQFHSAILEREGWNLWTAAKLPGLRPEDEAAARRLIERRESRERWGWKDPRTCLFLGLWNRLLPHARYLFIVRHPLLVCDSLRRRERRALVYWRSDSWRLNAWTMHTLACYRFARNNPQRAAMARIRPSIADPGAFARLLRERFQLDCRSEDFSARYVTGAMRTAVPWRRTGWLPIPFLRAMALYGRVCRQAAL